MPRTAIPLLVIVLSLICIASPAQKKKTKDTKPDKEQVTQTREALDKLKSSNPEEVVMGIQTLAMFGTHDAAPALEQLLGQGPLNDISDMAIQALGAIGNPSSVDILLVYLNHRRPEARIAACFALENFDDPRVGPALEKKLRDSDPQVRSGAALALGKRGTKETVPVLFTAFDMGIHDAIVSIGKLGTPEDAERAAEYLGKIDVQRLLPGFEQFLARPDIPEKAKLNILDRLFELAGPEVKRFAGAIKASFPPETKESENAIFKKASQMVRQIAEN